MELTTEKRKMLAERLEKACIAKYGKRFGIASKLAREVGVSVNTTSRWLRGDAAPDAERWAEIARLLDISVQWLLGATHDSPDAVASLNDDDAKMVSEAVRIVFPLMMKLKPDLSENEIVEITTHAHNQLKAGMSSEHISGEVVSRLFRKK